MSGSDYLNIKNDSSTTPKKKTNAANSKFIIDQGGTSPSELKQALRGKAKEFNKTIEKISKVGGEGDEFVLNVTPKTLPKNYRINWIKKHIFGDDIKAPEKVDKFILSYHPAKSTKEKFGITPAKEVYLGINDFLTKAPFFAKIIKYNLSQDIAEAIKLIK